MNIKNRALQVLENAPQALRDLVSTNNEWEKKAFNSQRSIKLLQVAAILSEVERADFTITFGRTRLSKHCWGIGYKVDAAKIQKLRREINTAARAAVKSALLQ